MFKPQKATPLRSAKGGIRTPTVAHWFLKPARLPVPPPSLREKSICHTLISLCLGCFINIVCEYYYLLNINNLKLIGVPHYSLENIFLNKKSKIVLFVI
jgi:hypothetical protein